MEFNPILDHTGLIRCGGRLQQSDLEFGRRHPILIPETKTGDAYVDIYTVSQNTKAERSQLQLFANKVTIQLVQTDE